MSVRLRMTEASWIGLAWAAAACVGGLLVLAFRSAVPKGLGEMLLGGGLILGVWVLLRSIDTPGRRHSFERAAANAAEADRCPRCHLPADWRPMPGEGVAPRTWLCASCGARLTSTFTSRVVTIVHWGALLAWAAVFFLFPSIAFGKRMAILAMGMTVLLVVSRIFHKWRLADGSYCPSCGYDRAGNVTGICSECGEALPDLAAIIKKPAESSHHSR